MREILFRGKTKKGNWAEGWFCGATCDSPHGDAYQSSQLIENNTLLWLDVIPETVGQYTGLTDKNGKKIFEGDILKGKDNLERVIEVYGYVDHQNGSFVIVGDLMTHYRWLDYNVEIIGNIHDNPELVNPELVKGE